MDSLPMRVCQYFLYKQLCKVLGSTRLLLSLLLHLVLYLSSAKSAAVSSTTST